MIIAENEYGLGKESKRIEIKTQKINGMFSIFDLLLKSVANESRIFCFPHLLTPRDSSFVPREQLYTKTPFVLINVTALSPCFLKDGVYKILIIAARKEFKSIE